MISAQLVEAIEAALMSRGGRRTPNGGIEFSCFEKSQHKHDDAAASAWWSCTKHCWSCRACGAKGGAVDAAARLGIPRPPAQHETGRWMIRNAAGVVVAIHVRLEPGRRGKAKDCVWERPDGQMGLGGVRAADLPLYGIHEVVRAPRGSTVICVEGEKPTDALTPRGILAVGTVTGAGATPSDDVLRPLLDYEVVLWPDHDDEGRTHMARIARRLYAMGCRSRWVTWPDAPAKGDAADWEGSTAELEALLKAAKPASDDEKNTDPRREETRKASANLPSQAARLVELAAKAELFHTADLEPFATIVVGEHNETFPLKSMGFRLWLNRLFHQATGKIPSGEALQNAIQTLLGQALFDGPERPVFTRIGELDGTVYLDCADPDWMAIAVNSMGWAIVKNPPTKFRRPRGMLPLPRPVHGGSLAELAHFANVWHEPTWRLIVAWLLATFRPHGPYPILVLNGEQGSAKSTLARVLRKLIDPNKVLLRRPSRDERDLMITATNSWIVALDNLSSLSDWMSDGLCMLATGGGFGTRELYQDQEEILFDATRPIVVNGIEEIATRGDFVDRALLVKLPAIPDERRRDEEQFWTHFDAAAPALLGALLDVVVGGLRRLPEVHLTRQPRLADFARFIAACEEALHWPAASFLATYEAQRRESASSVLEASPVATALCKFMDTKTTWEGTLSDLLDHLTPLVSEAIKQDRRHWPRTARGLRGQLDRIVPDLRRLGLEFAFEREAGGTRTRKVRITTVPTVPPSPKAENSGSEAGRSGDGRDDGDSQPSRDRPGETSEFSWTRDGGDGRDGRNATSSKDEPPPSAREAGEDDVDREAPI